MHFRYWNCDLLCVSSRSHFLSMATRSSVALTQVATLCYQLCLPNDKQIRVRKEGAQVENRYGNDSSL